MRKGPSGPFVSVVSVLPDVSGLDRTFDYGVPGDLQGPVGIGTKISVPLRNRRVRGWVVAERPAEAGTDQSLRPLFSVVSPGPTPEMLDLCRFAAWRYAGWLRPFLAASSPQQAVAVPIPPMSPTPSSPRPSLSPDGAIGDVVETALEHPCAVLRLPPGGSRLDVVLGVVSRRGPDGVLVLVPDRRAVEGLARRLRRRGLLVASMPEQWHLARAGGFVVVGTRSAVFAPLPRLSAIVVLDGDSDLYVSERAPTWQAPVLAVERARAADVPCILTSASPTLELSALGVSVGFDRPFERAGWPRIEVVDRRGDDPRSGLYAECLAEMIRTAAKDGRPVVCVLNRKGRARLLCCAQCGELARCESCGAALGERRRAAPEEPASLSCPACRLVRARCCGACGSARLKMLRVGVARSCEELSALTGLKVEEVSSETAGPSGDVPLLVGTEAVLHRVGAASLVVFLDFDDLVLSPRYRAGEDALCLLALAGRLVGGRGDAGHRRVVVQTRIPDHEVLVAARAGDPSILANAESPRRRQLRLPPEASVALVSGQGTSELVGALSQAVEVIRLEDDRVLLRAPSTPTLCDALVTARATLSSPLRIEVDPRRL